MTAAMIDSRDFPSARRRAETEVLIPAGTKIAFGGGIDYNDHERIWAKLDQALAKYPDMVLLHGGSPKGAERIAACWAEARKVIQIAFKPNGRSTPRPHRSAAMTTCSRSCRLASSSSPAPALPEILPTRPADLASPFWQAAGDGA
ncbi:hypothetical protein RLPCCGM1_p1789 [Rhizobium leguminosarum bv. phaseoli CCGM1]|nr:hypothetical protein RLPCCGM1_p1789 [Rhizobium leguminosarum bv. phaseoli CCGM1]